jgi:hypothetical protein
MAGGAVVADTCLAFNRKCWSFDLLDRIKTRPEIEPFLWDPENAILLLEYAKLLENCGWKITHFIDCPPVNGKVYRKYGKQNAGKKNPGNYQKNLDHRKTKYPSQTRIINHTRKRNYESIIIPSSSPVLLLKEEMIDDDINDILKESREFWEQKKDSYG